MSPNQMGGNGRWAFRRSEIAWSTCLPPACRLPAACLSPRQARQTGQAGQAGTAMMLILEPIFEADFLDCSYGFRPGRSAHQALEAVGEALKQGKQQVYDADLKGYFDSIPHDKLEACLCGTQTGMPSQADRGSVGIETDPDVAEGTDHRDG